MLCIIQLLYSCGVNCVLKFSRYGLQDHINSKYLYLLQFSGSVVSNSVRPHELQHARPPCPSPTPRVYSGSCPLSR